MPKIQVNDITMYYESMGQGEPLVLVTGFASDHSVWDNIAPQLAEHYHVILFDNRGCGQTDTPDQPYSIDQFADDAADLCKALNIHQAHFMGASMGGFIIQALAYRHSHLVRSLIIQNSVMEMGSKCGLFLETWGEILEHHPDRKAFTKLGLAWAFSSQFLNQQNLETLIEKSMENPHPVTLVGYKRQLAALTQFNSSSWAHKIQAPCLVIGSDQDMTFNRFFIQELAATIPGAQYYEFKNAGHVPSFEYPEEYVALTKQFLAVC